MKINNIYYVFAASVLLACSPKMADKKVAKSDTMQTAESMQTAPPMPGMDAKIPMDPSVRMGVLDNGLTYYVKNNGKPEDKVELRLAVNAGSVLEDDDQQGLAHFMEHMNFNGTTNFEKNELVDYLQTIGVKIQTLVYASNAIEG
jgi:zinc protease